MAQMPSGTSGYVLTAQGAGVDPAYAAGGGAPTKQFFEHTNWGSEQYVHNNHLGCRIDADGEWAYTEVMVPDDFSSLTEAKLVIIALAAVENMGLSVATYYGAAGEADNTHSQSTTVTVTTTQYYIYEIDISAVLSVLAAGDYVGFKIARPSLGNANCSVLGVMIKYS